MWRSTSGSAAHRGCRNGDQDEVPMSAPPLVAHRQPVGARRNGDQDEVPMSGVDLRSLIGGLRVEAEIKDDVPMSGDVSSVRAESRAGRNGDRDEVPMSADRVRVCAGFEGVETEIETKSQCQHASNWIRSSKRRSRRGSNVRSNQQEGPTAPTRVETEIETKFQCQHRDSPATGDCAVKTEIKTTFQCQALAPTAAGAQWARRNGDQDDVPMSAPRGAAFFHRTHWVETEIETTFQCQLVTEAEGSWPATSRNGDVVSKRLSRRSSNVSARESRMLALLKAETGIKTKFQCQTPSPREPRRLTGAAETAIETRFQCQ